MRSGLLLLHIVAGTLGMLSGFVAVFLRKGSRRHALAGNVFVSAMIGLSVSGFYLALMKSQPTNVAAATLTLYLVTTAWMTASRTSPRSANIWQISSFSRARSLFACSSEKRSAIPHRDNAESAHAATSANA